MSNLERMVTSEIVSRGAPRLVASSDKLQTLYLDDGTSVQPLNGYLYKWLTVADGTTTVAVGTLPAGAAVVEASVLVTEVFNKNTGNGSADTIEVGVTSDTDAIGTATSVKVVGRYPMTTGITSYVTTATPVVAKFASSGGTTNTEDLTGKALILVRYILAPAS